MIRVYDKSYAKDLNILRRNERIIPKILAEYCESIEETHEIFSGNNKNHSFVLFVDDSICGYIIARPKDDIRSSHIAKISMALDPNYFGRGLGSEMLDFLIKYLRKWTFIKQIQLTVLTNNERAIKLYKKFDFRKVGTLEKNTLVKGNLEDVDVMQLIL